MTKKELEMCDQELERMTNLINDMLDNTRLEIGKMRMHFEIFDITALIQTVVDNMQVVKKHHQIVFDNQSISYMVIGDKQRIEQVLLNLLTNAIKYSADGDIITIRIEKQKSHAVISVQDHGIGIAPKELKSIFDKFYQVKKRHGFGLGLYISKEIIKHHKGKIWAESKKGKGSTFFFSLPLQQDFT